MLQVQFGQAPAFFWWIVGLSLGGSLLIGCALGGAAKVIRAAAEYVFAKNVNAERHVQRHGTERVKRRVSSDFRPNAQ
jgi:hypothetical protein